MKRRIQGIGAAVICITLIGCGGGGGSGSSNSDPENLDNSGGTPNNDEGVNGENNNDTTCGDSEIVMEFSGLESESLGAAFWVTDSGAPEPPKTGHFVRYCDLDIAAYYYFASRDHIDATTVAGLRGKEIADMPEFSLALNSNNYSAEQVTI